MNTNKIQIKDWEYTEDDRVYINVNDLFDVCLIKTDEGLVIDVFARSADNLEPYGEPIATTYCYDAEARGES